MPDAPGVRCSREGAVATVTIDRPQRLNALDLATRRELLAVLRGIEGDDAVRAVVLTGSGRGFCVGQDLSATQELDVEETVAATYNPLVHLITTMPQPVVAAVNGLAVGAGLGLALACDWRLAAESASFACGFAKVGLVPDTAVSWFLVRELGHARAFEFALGGRSMGAGEALGLGLLNQVVPDDALAARAGEVAAALAAGPPLATAATKSAFRAVPQESFETILAIEARNQGRCARDSDHEEGRAAFLGKRPARWR